MSTHTYVLIIGKRGELQLIIEFTEQVWIIFWFHGNDQRRIKPKVYPPRASGRSVGMLASRTPHRYNPIGITAAKLVDIENGDTLVVSGVDLIDGYVLCFSIFYFLLRSYKSNCPLEHRYWTLSHMWLYTTLFLMQHVQIGLLHHLISTK